ncbi:MAG: hypothetical protein GXO00_02710, partial [Candidatus Diapherotrites archaeon]|nr:hypothetical protein [Candidatus Diapherotrites archaeon]
FLVSALFLYLAGVLTGAYLGSMTAFDITAPLQLKTFQLEQKVNYLEKDLSQAISYLYLLALADDENLACRVVSSNFQPLLTEISRMIELLPPRLEVADIPEDLLSRYTSLNVRAYLAADYLYRSCGGAELPALYVYEPGDLNAGYAVDALREEYNLLVFVASPEVNDPFVEAIGGEPPFILVCGEIVSPYEANEVVERCLAR